MGTHEDLSSNVQAIKQSEKRLAAINQISSAIAQSLELKEVLRIAINNVVDVMQVDASLIFLLNDDTAELELSAHSDLSEEFVHGVDRLKIGEGFNGRVVQTGEPLFVEDVSKDPRLTREVVSKYGIHSVLVVPLSCRGRVNGTLNIAMYTYRLFSQDEIEILSAVGNQIGVAVENARLYKKLQVETEQLRLMQENLRFFLQQVTNAQEEERKRISHELHDETIQALVALSRRLDLMTSDKKMPEKYHQHLEEIRHQINEIIREVRRLSQDLRPAALDRLGLLPALEWLASEVKEYSKIEVEVKVIGEKKRFPAEVELVLFRISQEALRNVWKHSGASEAGILILFDKDKIIITISDNGRGFHLPERPGDLARHGKLGLAGMHERVQLIGGTLTADSHPGEGTRITIEMPT